MDQSRLAQIALHFIPGIRHMLAKQLVSYSGSAEALLNLNKSKLLKIPGIGPQTAETISKGLPLKKAEEELEACQKIGADILIYTDKEFPNRLNHINDAPSLLYSKGKVDFNQNKVISIVGTRNATKYGKEVTRELVEQLVPHEVLIVSGLAYGIDIQAHKAALGFGLPTVGVMASGVDIIYPAIHKEVAHKMTENGALISENSLGSKPDAPKFPARNRIIAGMCDAIIVVEAASKGGALITAEIGNSYNKDVFAVPGNIKNEYSEGCNKLIRANKANLLTSATDIEYIMNWDLSSHHQPKRQLLDVSTLPEEEQHIVSEMQNFNGSILLDNLSWHTKLPVNKLASILLNLEFKGFVTSLPGKKFELTSK